MANKLTLEQIKSCCHDDSAGGGCLYLDWDKLEAMAKGQEESKGEWQTFANTYPLADTGDYNCEAGIVNGGYKLISCGREEFEMEELEDICDKLNAKAAEVTDNELQELVIKFLKENHVAGPSFSFCQGFKTAINIAGANWMKEQGVSDGWIKVNSPDDYPTEDCRYWIANENGVFAFFADKDQIRRKFENKTLTHYRKLQEVEPPKQP